MTSLAIARAAKDVPAEGLLERVEALVPMIRAGARQAEEQRAPLDSVIAALGEAGVFRALVPPRYGGYAIDMELFVDIGLTVGKACMSTAWITTFYIEHNHLFTMFDRAFQDEVFAHEPYVLMAGAVNPRGKATKAPGGYRVTGQWPFGSGIVHADWVGITAMDGEARRMFMFRRDEVQILDTWHVAGMAGTGSHDVVVTDQFIEDARVSLDRPAPAEYPLPIQPLLSMTAAVPALAGALRAVELFQQRLSERVMFSTGKLQADQAAAQIRLANLIVEVQGAEHEMRRIARLATAHARGQAHLDLLEQTRIRLAISHIVRRARNVIRDVMEASGASAHYLDHELQRIHRDVHVIAGHVVFDVEANALNLGKALLAAKA